jgi:hypothetical protein
MAALAVSGTPGCVERRMLIRSEPPGAPVWVDDVPVGVTPLDHPFKHYGLREIRVGPILNEEGWTAHTEMTRVVDFNAPWYETFPVDFFFEVLYPVTLVDEHEVPVFVLGPSRPEESVVPDDAIQRLRDRAEAFREEATTALPEEKFAR